MPFPPQLLTPDQRPRVSAWLADWRKRFTEDQWWASYQTWARNGDAWTMRVGLGGTDTQSALTWYQHFHKPGSTDSRPSVVVPALLRAMETSERTDER